MAADPTPGNGIVLIIEYKGTGYHGSQFQKNAPHLPRDIAAKEAFKTNGPFEVRRRAVSREYKYYILISRTRSPMRQGFSCRVTGDLDINAMNRACQALIG